MVPEIVRLERSGMCGCGELVAAGERAGYAALHESIVCLDCLADLTSRTDPADPADSLDGDSLSCVSDDTEPSLSPDRGPAETPPSTDLVSAEWTRREAAVAATLHALRAGSTMTHAASALGVLHVPAAWSAPTPPVASTATASAPPTATMGLATALAEPAQSAELAEATTAPASTDAAQPADVSQPQPQVCPTPDTTADTPTDTTRVEITPEPSPPELKAARTVRDEVQTLTRRSRHEAATVEDVRMPASAHRRRAGLFTRLLTVRSLRQSGQPFAAGKPDAAVAALLDAAVARGVLSLHDRHIPGRRGRIEHIAVGASGVYVIDVKHFKNASIELRHTEDTPVEADDLVVGGRVMTAALVANQGRVAELRSLLADAGLDDVPVTGALCFVDGLLPLSVGDLEVSGVHVMRPSGLTALVAAGGDLDGDDREKLQQFLAHHLPACA